jgi:hypothetical protein
MAGTNPAMTLIRPALAFMLLADRFRRFRPVQNNTLIAVERARFLGRLRKLRKAKTEQNARGRFPCIARGASMTGRD